MGFEARVAEPAEIHVQLFEPRQLAHDRQAGVADIRAGQIEMRQLSERGEMRETLVGDIRIPQRQAARRPVSARRCARPSSRSGALLKLISRSAASPASAPSPVPSTSV